MPYSLVVFDWDGTLMDSTHSIVAAIQGACRDLELRRAVGLRRPAG